MLLIVAGDSYRAAMTSQHNTGIITTVIKTVQGPPSDADWSYKLYHYPWFRGPPYVVGVLLGFMFFMLAKKKKSVRIPFVSLCKIFNLGSSTSKLAKKYLKRKNFLLEKIQFPKIPIVF